MLPVSLFVQIITNRKLKPHKTQSYCFTRWENLPCYMQASIGVAICLLARFFKTSNSKIIGLANKKSLPLDMSFINWQKYAFHTRKYMCVPIYLEIYITVAINLRHIENFLTSVEFLMWLLLFQINNKKICALWCWYSCWYVFPRVKPVTSKSYEKYMLNYQSSAIFSSFIYLGDKRKCLCNIVCLPGKFARFKISLIVWLYQETIFSTYSK